MARTRPRKLADLDAADKPRERLERRGADALREEELMAVVLGKGMPGRDAITLSKDVLREIGLELLNSERDITDLLKRMEKIAGVGKAKALQIIAAVALGKSLQIRQDGLEQPIREAKDVYNICRDLVGKQQEELVCLYLNSRNVMLDRKLITKGLLDKSLFHPREVFATALETRAASIIVVHNHPSGDPTPSSSDRVVVRRLAEAGKTLGIDVLDFVIIAKHRYISYLGMVEQDEEEMEMAEDAPSFNLSYVGDGTGGSEPTRTLLDYESSL